MSVPEPPDPVFPRVSAIAFPPRRFLPGQGPHPDADPQSRVAAPPPVSGEWQAALADWRCSAAFCFGVDLYNYAYWWEAHEAWESLWLGVPERAPVRALLQGLIQISAAHLQRFRGFERGVAKLLGRARRNLLLAQAGGDVLLGVAHPRWWSEQVCPYFDRRPGATYPFLQPL